MKDKERKGQAGNRGKDEGHCDGREGKEGEREIDGGLSIKIERRR